MLGIAKVREMQPLMGSEDFSFYQELIPGYFFFLGMKDETLEQPATAHSPYYRINEDGLAYGAALHASMVVRYLFDTQKADPKDNGYRHDEL